MSKLKQCGSIIGFFFFLSYLTGCMMSGTLDITQWEEVLREGLGGLSGALSLCTIGAVAATDWA